MEDARSNAINALCRIARRCYDRADQAAEAGDFDAADRWDARGHAFIAASDEI